MDMRQDLYYVSFRLERKFGPAATGSGSIERGFSNMATMISEDCINCGACEDECPNEAISMGEEIFVIEPELCTECVAFSSERACAAACPPDVCIQDPERIETEDVLFGRARQLHPEQAATMRLDESTSHFRATPAKG
jgi:ferredoxin